MVTVVIPLYNKQSTIEATLSSVLGQTYKHFEIIVVNDGSTDGSVQIVESFKDDRIRIINKPNSGVSDARNLGIAHAKYDWIALLDGDDLKHPEALEEYVSAINRFPNYMIYSTGYSIVRYSKNIRYENKYLPFTGETGVVDLIDCLSYGQLPINSSNSVFNKVIFEKAGGFKSGQRNYEDHDLWLRMYNVDGIVFINKDLVSIRRDLINTARQTVISKMDLLSYLHTIQLTKERVPKEKSVKFKIYYHRFCLWIFFKVRKHYTPGNKKEILDSMKKIVIRPFWYILWVLNKSS